MKDQLINFETAKLAFEKGLRRKGEIFSENKVLKINLDGISCSNCFNLDGKEITPKYVLNKNHYPRPSQSLLQKWLWDTHSIWVMSFPEFSVNEVIGITVTITSWKFRPIVVDYNGWGVYDGLEVGLQEALKLIDSGN